MKTKKNWRNLLVFAITCVMLCVTAIPAFAKGETQTMTYYVLYVDDSYNLGYHYSEYAKWTADYECQYDYCGSGSYNHSIKVADIKAQLGKANSYLSADDGWEIVGWSKEASANPNVIKFKPYYSNYPKPETTATQTTYQIYLVAKKPTSDVVLDANDGAYNDGSARKTLTGKAGNDVTTANGYEEPTRDGYTFLGWAATASASTVLDSIKFGKKSATYYAVWEENIVEETTFDVIYHSVDNPAGRKVTENILDVSGTYNALNKLDGGYLYGGTFSDADCTSAYDFANGENGMGFTPKAGETYHVWELDAKYLAPRNYSIWRIIAPGSARVHVSDVYMLFALDRLNYREAGFDVNVQESSGGGGNLQSLGANRKSLYNGDKNGTDIAYETIDVTRPNGTLEDFLYVKSGTIYSSGSKIVNKPERDPGYIVISKLNDEDFAYFSARPSNVFSFIPYYITVDGIRVTGTTKRICGYRGDGLVDDDYDYRTLETEDKRVDSTATSVDSSSKLKLFRSNNGIMRSAGSFTVENGGV